jgi:hypothetical protein
VTIACEMAIPKANEAAAMRFPVNAHEGDMATIASVMVAVLGRKRQKKQTLLLRHG